MTVTFHYTHYSVNRSNISQDMYEQNLMSLSLSPKIKHFVDSVVCVCACAEIKAMPDLNLESDMKLDKLESFLGKLNNKSESFTDMSINGACLHVGMEADSYKWYQTIFYKSNIWHGAVGFPFRSCCKTVLFKYWEPGKRWSFHSDVSEWACVTIWSIFIPCRSACYL